MLIHLLTYLNYVYIFFMPTFRQFLTSFHRRLSKNIKMLSLKLQMTASLCLFSIYSRFVTESCVNVANKFPKYCETYQSERVFLIHFLSPNNFLLYPFVTTQARCSYKFTWKFYWKVLIYYVLEVLFIILETSMCFEIRFWTKS